MQTMTRKSPAAAAGQTHYHIGHDLNVIIPPRQSPVEQLLSRLSGVRRTRNGWMARCPAHQDRSPSLSIAQTPDGKILLHCFAGCRPEAVLAAVGLRWADISRPVTAEDRQEAELRRRLEDLRWQVAYWLAGWLRDHDVPDGTAPGAGGHRYVVAPYMHLIEWGDWQLGRLLMDDTGIWLPAVEEVLSWVHSRN